MAKLAAEALAPAGSRSPPGKRDVPPLPTCSAPLLTAERSARLAGSRPAWALPGAPLSEVPSEQLWRLESPAALVLARREVAQLPGGQAVRPEGIVACGWH